MLIIVMAVFSVYTHIIERNCRVKIKHVVGKMSSGSILFLGQRANIEEFSSHWCRVVVAATRVAALITTNPQRLVLWSIMYLANN